MSPRLPAPGPSVLGTLALMLMQALDARGVDGRALAARAGIDPALLDDPNSRFPIAATTRLWRLAVEATGDPCFGLWASRFVNQTTFHGLGFAVFASRTLRDAFERFVRYGRLVSDVAEVQLRRVGQREQVRFVPLKGQPQPAAEAVDATLCLIARMARMLSGGKVNPVAVRLERPEPSPSEPFRKAFRAPVQFGQRENVLEFAASDLDEQLPTGNAELARHNDEVVARYLARIDYEHVSNRLRSWLVERLADGEPTEEAAARALGMSVRNLQRRLQREGTTYREALNGTREEMARAYLEEGRSSVSEIAFLLGFSDSNSFSRAFRRWANQSPRAYCRARVPVGRHPRS
jgi:AraC-like DNA-binding protein